MRQILKELNSQADIVGSMVITQDGIMVAAALGKKLEEDVLAAFASSLLVSMKRGLARIGAPSPLSSCTLNGSNGKIAFYDMKNAYLVVVADTSTQLDEHTEEIQTAIHKIQNRRVA
ncbi:MAG: roadblock/LC7 domain-containing protein [Planctomycetota bacterium]|nr:roadblock/LC7 domain-containing protein [Planctomycetota bacterium]